MLPQVLRKREPKAQCVGRHGETERHLRTILAIVELHAHGALLLPEPRAVVTVSDVLDDHARAVIADGVAAITTQRPDTAITDRLRSWCRTRRAARSFAGYSGGPRSAFCLSSGFSCPSRNYLSADAVRAAISGRRLKSLPAALWCPLRRHLDLDEDRQGSDEGKVARHRTYFPDTLPCWNNSEQEAKQ